MSSDLMQRTMMEYRLETIRECMPGVHAMIKARAEQIGPEAYALVRRGLRGEPGCFYALEAGHVAGTPFGAADPRMQDLAAALVWFGGAHVCIWPADKEGSVHGPD
ncbi:hypothetical protein [Paracidovorax citrulli]|uniref:hypothetical protein n=1 Tax=Paracidovorax citrulli TaxID=80869 RepID=UPI000AFA3B66|nr:hypothetical protein [Paracidovorax citrulli]